MEANLIVAGVPRRIDPADNERRIAHAVQGFRLRYPSAIVEGPLTKLIGERSQIIGLTVQMPDLCFAQTMQRYFEDQLQQAGFSPTADETDADACVDEIFRRFAGQCAGKTSNTHPPHEGRRPWWKFW